MRMLAQKQNLSSLYETEELYSAKLAGKETSFAAVAIPLLGIAALHMLSKSSDKALLGAGLKKQEQRDYQAALNSGDVDALRGDTSLREVDEKAASVADRIGRTLAKSAGIGGIISSAGNIATQAGKSLAGALKPGFATKALALGGLGIAGYAGLKGGKALYNAGMEPAHEKIYGAGPALPRYVNQYGVPS